MSVGSETAPTPPTVEVLSSLTAADVEDFARLLPQLSSTPRTEAEIAQNLHGALNSPTSRIVVIRGDDGRIKASATGNLCPIPTGYKPWVDDVVTDQEHRGRGYGRRLMDTLHDWFEEIGAPYANLTSTPDKAAAGSLYEDMGYRERRTRVYRLLLPVGSTATEQATA